MEQEQKKPLELLPKGAFIINTKDKPLKGRFSMYVLDLFCIRKEISSYLVLVQRIVVGMSLGDYAELILIAIDDYYRNMEQKSGLTKADIMDMIDEELDGISTEEFKSLVFHAVGRVANVKKIEEDLKNQAAEAEGTEADEQKKTELTSNLIDTTSGSPATKQD